MCLQSPDLWKAIVAPSRNISASRLLALLVLNYPNAARKESLKGIDDFFKGMRNEEQEA